MRDYKLGFTANTVTHNVTRGWFRVAKRIDETVVEYHAMEKGERVCGSACAVWILGEVCYLGMGKGQELAAPFNKRNVTCKKCLDKLEANRVSDLEADVARLQGQAKGHESAITQLQDRNDALNRQLTEGLYLSARTHEACYEALTETRQLLEIRSAQLRSLEAAFQELEPTITMTTISPEQVREAIERLRPVVEKKKRRRG